MHAGESYPASGLSVEITPLLLLCGVSACLLDESSSYTTLLELFDGRRKKGTASLLLLLAGCLELAGGPTLCMGAPGGLYRPTPRGYNCNPAGRGSQPSVSTLAGFSAGRWGPPTGGSRRLPASWSTGRPHRLGVLSAAVYCSLAPDDEGFVEISVATVCRLEGSHCSLTSSCLLNVAHASREG